MNNISIKNLAKKNLKDVFENFKQKDIVNVFSNLAKRFKQGQKLRQSIEILSSVMKKMKPKTFERKLKMKFGLLSDSVPSKISKKTVCVIKNLVRTDGKSITKRNYTNKNRQNISLDNVNNSFPTKAHVLYVLVIYLLDIPRSTATGKEDKFLIPDVINFNKALITLANVVSRTRRNVN